MEFKFRKKKYTLKRDANCFVLAELAINKKTNDLEEREHEYYTTINNVLTSLFNKHVLDKGSYSSLTEAINAANRDIKKLLASPLFEGSLTIDKKEV